MSNIIQELLQTQTGWISPSKSIYVCRQSKHVHFLVRCKEASEFSSIDRLNKIQQAKQAHTPSFFDAQIDILDEAYQLGWVRLHLNTGSCILHVYGLSMYFTNFFETIGNLIEQLEGYTVEYGSPIRGGG